MSQTKDKIREMVMALAKGDHDTAQAAIKEVSAEKAKMATEAVLDDLEEDSHMLRAARRHSRAGKRDMEAKRDVDRDMNTRDDKKAARTDEDTGADSSVMKGKHDMYPFDNEKFTDAEIDSDKAKTLAGKGKDHVKDAKNIDHKDYSDKKRNAYKKGDPTDKTPVNK